MTDSLPRDLVALLDEPQFSRPQVALITDLTDGQLKGILDRKVVKLQTHNPGSGNPRLFSGSDNIKIAVANAMARVGIPMRHLASYAALVDQRARQLMEIAQRYGPDLHALSVEEFSRRLPANVHWQVWWMLFPMGDRDGEWSLVPFHSRLPFDPKVWPVSYSVLQVDEIIDDTIRRMAAIDSGEAVSEREAMAKLRKGGDAK